MGRYSGGTLTFTTSSILAGATSDLNKAINWNHIDIVKIKVVPSISTGTTKISFFKKDTFLAADRCHRTKAFSGSEFDPCDNDGTTVTETAEGFILPYEDLDLSLELHMRIENLDTVAKTYTVTILYLPGASADGSVTGVPEEIEPACTPVGLTVNFSALARKNAGTITAAELRVQLKTTGIPASVDLRTVAEGGSFVHNGTDKFIVTGIVATPTEAGYAITFGSAGIAFYAWRLRNSAGWSNWTDGNSVPSTVRDYCQTQNSGDADVGPPSAWNRSVEPGPLPNTVVVRASRPRVYGKNISAFGAMVKNSATGSWRALDANAGAAVTSYDGSAINHSLLEDGHVLKRASGAGFGTAVSGTDILMVDVRGSAFNNQYCFGSPGPFRFEDASGNEVAVGSAVQVRTPERLLTQVTSLLRARFVKAPWNWTTEGYLGAQPSRGWYAITYAEPDLDSDEFVTPPIQIPAGLTQIEARTFFRNGYCVSDDNLGVAALGLGGSGILGPQIFTDFGGRLFLPVYAGFAGGAGGTATMTFNPDGSVTISTLGGGVGEAGSGMRVIRGVRSRFRLMYGSDGEIRYRVKFTDVSMPPSPGGVLDPGQIAGLLTMMTPNGNNDYQGACFISAENVTTYGCGKCTVPNLAGGLMALSTPSKADIARTTDTFTSLEIRCFIRKGTDATTFQDVEYNLDGAGFLSVGGGGPQFPELEAVFGNPIFIGALRNRMESAVGIVATLKEFELIKGIAVVEG